MKEYFPRLDALRFLAFLVVFANHIPSFLHFPFGVNTPGTPAFVYLQDGDLAVGFFFVLSAFLVTYLFEKERVKKGTIVLTNFYRRRMLRIWPLYFFVIGLIALVSLFVSDTTPLATSLTGTEFAAALTFLTGIFRPLLHSSNEMLAVLWSISVEEQFYLLWPFVFRFCRKYAWVFLVGIAVVSMAFRYLHANDFEMREFHPLSGVVYLCIGALAGIYGHRFREWIVRHARLLSAGSLVTVIAVLSVRGFAFGDVYPGWFVAIDALLFGLCFVAIVLANAFAGASVLERSKNKLLAYIEYLGSISYGLYVYHLIAFTVVLSVLTRLGFSFVSINSVSFILIALITFGITLLMAATSYRFLETPFLLLKKKLSNV